MNKTIEDLYQAIALGVYQAKPEGEWISAEYEFTAITLWNNAICTYFMKDGRTVSVDGGYEAQSGFAKLREEMANLDSEKRAWYTGILTLTSDGDFNFDFDYDHLPTFDIIPSPDKWLDEFNHHPRPELQVQIQDWIDKKELEPKVIVQRLRELQAQ